MIKERDGRATAVCIGHNDCRVDADVVHRVKDRMNDDASPDTEARLPSAG